MKTEVIVPRRVPSDHFDVVVYRDDACKEPYLVVENKSPNPDYASQAGGCGLTH
jgi:type I restriction enzyme M protein